MPTRAIPQGQPAPESGNRHSDQVPMQVLKAPGGQALALVPVYLEGQGPFSFALDTGASNSAVDLAIAQKLHLPDQGSAVAVSGVNKSSHAVQVAVKQWRVGDIPLPARILLATDMSALHKESGLQGLLGSDILSQFDSVTIDYQGKRLLLRHSR